MPEVEIIRKSIFVVDHTELDEEYGKLIITDKEGKTHTVNKKHESLHPVFADGIAVEVGYGSYMNKEFIHTARQVKDALPPPVPVAIPKAPPDAPQPATSINKPPAAPPPSTSRRPPLDDKTRGVALSYAKDMAVAKIIEKEKILDWAAIFATFIDGNIEIDDLKVLELVRTKLFKATE